VLQAATSWCTGDQGRKEVAELLSKMRVAVSFLLLVLVGVAFAEVARNDEVRDLLLDLLDGALAKRASTSLVASGGGIHYCGKGLDSLINEHCSGKREAVEDALMSPQVARRFFGTDKWNKRDLHQECCVEVCAAEEVLETC